MSVLLNPYRLGPGGGGGSWPGFYALAGGNNTDVADAPAMHSGGTFTIPSAWNGRKARVAGATFGNLGSSTTPSLGSSLKGGVSFPGLANRHWNNGTGATDGGSWASAPVVVSTGDTFTLTGVQASFGWKQVEVLPASLKSAMVQLNSTFSFTAATWTAITWDIEAYDTDSWHDNVTNPSRLTVPSGVSLVRVTGSVKTNGASGSQVISIYKNGSPLTALVACDLNGNGQYIDVFSYPIAVTAGDYFELFIYGSTATQVLSDNASWFAIEELPSSLKYAVGYCSANTANFSANVNNAVPADSELADVGGWYTPGNGFMTVPSGVSLIRAGYCGKRNSATALGPMGASLQFNTTDVAMSPSTITTNALSHSHAQTSILAATSGDTVTFYCNPAGGSQRYGPGACFWVEEVQAITS